MMNAQLEDERSPCMMNALVEPGGIESVLPKGAACNRTTLTRARAVRRGMWLSGCCFQSRRELNKSRNCCAP